MISLDTGLWRGQGAGFNPLSLSPLAWWDWSDSSQLYTDSGLTTLVSADGDPIGGIKDKSGSNYHLVQTDGTKKGLYKTNIQNGKSVGRTDGVNDCWQVASSTALFNCLHYGGATVFFAQKVGTTNNATTSLGIFGNNGGASSQIGLSVYYDGPTAVGRLDAFATKGGGVITSGGTWSNGLLPSNTPLAMTCKIDPQNATPANRLYIYKGSNAAASGNTASAVAVNSSASGLFTVGAIGGTSVVAFAPNDHYELIIYPTLLSDANRVLVRDYLMAKWGV